MAARISVIDLFAGAGGLSLGAVAAGADVRLSVDNDADSCKTLEANPEALGGGAVMCADVAGLSGQDLLSSAGLDRGDPLLVIGGAPCQPFSKAAYWVEAGDEAAYRRARAAGDAVERPAPPEFARPDDRRTLVEEFWRLVDECDADGFVFENVRSITHPRNKPVLEALENAARGRGYKLRFAALNAADFGVPQRRQRVFLIGSKQGRPEGPEETHAPAASAEELGRDPYEVAGPALAPYAGADYFEPEEVVEGRWAEHLTTVPPGGNYKAHTAWGGHPNPTWETETRYWNFLLKLSPELPSWTVNASPGPWTGPFHWDSRRLRTPELAALQTFPDGYRFVGSRRERVRQIGNAVPVRLAAAVVEVAVAALCEQGEPLLQSAA
ncbi:MAG TPA: DNA cytosine methyltransferase [Solirubrobacterales bacterium]|nr:DNA cytosine methyltransferase [Solirubrobacterales bacterium]